VHASAGTAATSYGYTGEWTDGTGLVHLRARYLNTGVARFTSNLQALCDIGWELPPGIEDGHLNSIQYLAASGQ
jgi:RHS repeat-associated protein